MLIVTGPIALPVAEAHRRVRDDLAMLRARTLGLALEMGPPELVERARTDVLDLLVDVVLPLADLEDELAHAQRLRPASPSGASAADRLEHDLVRELTTTLRETRPVLRDDRDQTIGALHAVADLLPAHVDGEELALLTALATLDHRGRAQLRDVTDRLPPPRRRPRPLARLHLSTGLEVLTERLTDGSDALLATPAIGGRQRDAGTEPEHRRMIVPVAVAAGPDAVALRFVLDEDHDHGTTTLAYLDGWLTSTGHGASVLELRATPPPYRPERLPVSTGEVRHTVAQLGRSLARHLHHDLPGVGSDRLDAASRPSYEAPYVRSHA